MTTTISAGAARRSRLAERVNIPPDEGAGRDTSLARVEVTENEARAWRITLGRADRQDQRGPLVRGGAVSASSPIFNSQLYSYAAGFQNTPASPPVRDNPVATAGADCDPLFVQVAWGMSVGGAHRLIAHWPMQGASLVVYGSFVEVFAGTFLAGYSGVPLDDTPTLQASIAPADGLAVSAAGELSIQQDDPITVGYAAAGDPAVLYVPDYAREVRVVLVDPVTLRVFDFGHPRCLLEWFDDGPNVIDGWAQGSSIGVTPGYQRVPARATMLRIGTPGANLDCGETPFATCVAMTHWRLAP
jgi:hypothetical protein